MTTITKERIELFIKNPLENGLTRGEQMELARIALTSLEAEPVAYIFKHPAGKLFWALTDESNKEQADVIPVYAAAPAPVVPDNASEPLAYAYKELTPEIMRNHLAVFERYGIAPNDSSTTIQALRIALDGIERSDAMLHGAEPVSQTYKLNELAGNSPVIPGEVLSAILKVARVRADFDDFDGDRRGIGDCLDEAEQELIVTINKYASQLAAGPIAPNDVREQTAVPPVPVIQADVAQAIEKLKRKLVECNRYNYCADAVKGVEDASRVLALQNKNMSAPITPEAIENAIEYIRSIAFHIDEDDYHGKHIAYFMRQALVWLEGHSCSDDRQGKAENQPVRGNQAAESNRGNEWTGNPDIDNAIIMLDRIDTLESCDDDRIEAVKTVLRRLAGNSPVIPDGLSTVCAEAYQVVGVMADALGVFGDAAVQKVLDNLSQQKLVHRDVLPFSLPVTPDGWVMVPKQVTPEISNAINVVGQRCTCGNCSQRLWDLLLDATQQGVNRG
ncbi:Phage EaA protein [Salmonella enterica subsp. enterica serovar Typhi]|nr:Phage EaA protein [Salmonella enterica subsp. enterica serovar Typhi]